MDWRVGKLLGDNMKFIEKLALDQIKIFENWRSAPIGSVLQVRIGDEPVVAMRTSLPHGQRNVHALLVLSGGSVGLLMTGGQFEGPALDVSDLVEFVGETPAAFDVSNGPKLANGALLRFINHDRVYVCWYRTTDGNSEGAVCVASDFEDVPVGVCMPDMPMRGVIGAADRVAVVERQANGNRG